METKDRIKAIMEHYGLSVGEFARKVGVKTNQAVYDILSGKTRSVSSAMCGKIGSAFPELNKGWLLTGEGSMLSGGPELAAHQVGADGAPGLPLVPLEAVAGLPGEDFAGITLVDCERYLVPEFSHLGAQFLIRVAGTSMQPRYNSGDLLAVRKISSANFLQWGKVYVLDTEQGLLVKKVMPCEGDDDAVMCISENAAEYPPFRLPRREIRSLSIVVGHVSVE